MIETKFKHKRYSELTQEQKEHFKREIIRFLENKTYIDEFRNLIGYTETELTEHLTGLIEWTITQYLKKYG